MGSAICSTADTVDLVQAISGPVVWRPQKGPQTSLVACPVTDVLYGGARGGGKTDGLLGEWLIHEKRVWDHYREGYARGLFLRRTLDELDEVIDRSKEIYPEVGAVWRAAKHYWQFPSGSFLRMRYLKRDEDASHYQGHSYTRVDIDEAGNFPTPNPIDKLLGTLRSKYGVPCRMRLSANPGGPGQSWIKQRYMTQAPPMVPFFDEVTGVQRVYIPSRLSDNPLLTVNDPGYAGRLRGVGPGWLVKAWLDGDWDSTPEGGLIKGEWLQQRYRQIPAEYRRIVQSWDTAQKPNQIVNDPSVCTTWVQTRNRIYLADCWRDWVNYPELVRAAKVQAEKWKPDVVLIEDKSSGISLIQQLRNETSIPILPIEPDANKEFRLFAASGAFEAGVIWLPEVAPWVLDYEIELTTFPMSPHADRVDSTSQAVRYMVAGVADLTTTVTGDRRGSADAFGSDQTIRIEDSGADEGFASARIGDAGHQRYGRRR